MVSAEERQREVSTPSLKRTDTIEIDYSGIAPVPSKKTKVATEGKNYDAQWATWAQCAEKYQIVTLQMSGYLVFANKDLMMGTPVTRDLKAFLIAKSKKNSDLQALRTLLAANYKIHLMPFDEDIVPVMATLLAQIKQDAKLQQSISYFKIRAYTDQIKRDSDNTYLPIFVIYTHGSKEAAQYTLDSVYALFKNQRGLEITPRYNQKITSLIYYAQGDGDFKKDQFADYYEQDRIHYRADFEGEKKDYYLKNPVGKV